MRDIKDYTEQYQTDTFELEYKVPYRRKHVLEIMNQYPHESILEIGCGMESILKSVDYQKGTIVEPSEVFANQARHIQGVRVIQSCLEDCIQMLQQEEFDFIVISALLHEVESPVNFLRHVHDVCSKKTIVHINVPNANSFHRLLGVQCGQCADTHDITERNKQLQQHSVFDAKTLEKTIQEAGSVDGMMISICSRGGYFIKPFSNRQMAKCLESGAITPELIAGLDRMIDYLPDLGSEIYVNYRVK